MRREVLATRLPNNRSVSPESPRPVMMLMEETYQPEKSMSIRVHPCFIGGVHETRETRRRP